MCNIFPMERKKGGTSINNTIGKQTVCKIRGKKTTKENCWPQVQSFHLLQFLLGVRERESKLTFYLLIK